MDFSFLNFSTSLVMAHILFGGKIGVDPKKRKLRKVGRFHYLFHLAFAFVEPLVLKLVDYLCGKESQASTRMKLWFLTLAANTVGPLLPNGVIITTSMAERWIDFLDKHEGPKGARFAVGPCLCQQAMKRWEEPIVKDIFFVYAADIFTTLKRGFTIVSSNEAKRIVRECRDAGLVHELDYCMQSGRWSFVICSCEPRICALTRVYLKTGKLLTAGPEIVLHDAKRCLGREKCGRCIEVCIFNANRSDNKTIQVDYSKCLGCGLCVLSCEGRARKMKLRDHYTHDVKIPSEILLGQ
jgi:NAD-dependent dihydropyrimidine dehydrogenase PreA subunit